jgi:hypothetical protein
MSEGDRWQRAKGWVCNKLAGLGKKAYSWCGTMFPGTTATWWRSGSRNITARPREKGAGYGFCLIPCPPRALANPIESRWVHVKREVVEADGLAGGWRISPTSL